MADAPIDSRRNDFVVKDGDTSYRRSVQHLPSFYRTDANQRFLGSTLDALIQPGSLERLDGFIGRQDAYTREAADTYIKATSDDRQNYQLEPTVTYTNQDTTSINPEDQVQFLGTYDDFINSIKTSGGHVANHDRLNKESVYAWNPAIDFDKLINYREYYWMPEGPNAILVSDVGKGAITEIEIKNNLIGGYQFSTHGTATNPVITLFRGNTYKFKINAEGHPFYIQTETSVDGLAQDDSTSVRYTSGVTNAGTDQGTVTFVVPTDAPNQLFYQCGNHQKMAGTFQIKTVTETTKIDVENFITGARNYTTSSGVVLSNGMKIKFGTNVTDTTNFSRQEFYVEGVGSSITLTNIDDLLTPESYATETTILYDSALYDSRPYAKAFYRPETPDYITIKRDSLDKNAWSRYNRWFHRSVIEATGTANGYTAELLETDRAKRPIIEFDSGLALYNHGTVAKKSITVYDSKTTDVGSQVVNATGYIVDGISLQDGMRVVFTNDTDVLYKNKIFKVSLVSIAGTDRINLTEESDSSASAGESIFIELGTTNQGKTFYYDGTTNAYIEAQEKTKLNQQPLFGVFDENHVSLDDATVYPNSDFFGAKVFGFKTTDTATTDSVLGLKVKYNTINNVGDIVFDTDLSSGTFKYKVGNEFVTQSLGSGHLHYTTGLTTHNSRAGWIRRDIESYQRVIRNYVVTADERKLFPIDVYKESASLTDLEVNVDVNTVRQSQGTDYNVVKGTTNAYVSFVEQLDLDDVVVIKTKSATDKVAGKGYYEVAENLSVNPLNANLSSFTFGQISHHVKDIVEKNNVITGKFPGVSTLRDNPDARTLGGTIIQHNGGSVPATFNMIDDKANFLSGLDYARKEYEKFKSNFLTLSTAKSYNGDPVAQVDEIIKKLTESKTNSFPFYYEDMIGHGENVSVRTYTVQDSTDTEYAIDSVFSTSTLSNRAVYIHLNNEQLINGADYTFNSDDSVAIKTTLTAGDELVIRDYENTIGSCVPPTPVKLGMLKKHKPEIVTDNTYRTSKRVLIGHDGSITPVFDDFRDDILLELEKRIYNNIKISFDEELLDAHDVIPSAFRSTDYNISEVNEILGYDFYEWAGRYSIQYRDNKTYEASDKFTYNYGDSKGTVTGEKLPGYWRGIFKLHYDTDKPHTNPWEMLGFSEKPTWWESTYGPAPYTSGNLPMWTDIKNGLNKNTKKVNSKYAMAGLLDYLPVDENGNLRDPITIGLVDGFTTIGVQKQWKFGDHAPSETAWRRSSAFGFTLCKLLVLTKPAKFFGVFFDNSRLKTNVSGNLVSTETGVRQTLADSVYHLETRTNTTTGVTTRYQTAGYQPYVVNWLIQQGLDPAVYYYDKMKNLNVQLAYKLGGFTDKNNIKILTDSVSPGSTSGSQFIPEENYKIIFRSSNAVDIKEYSGVVIEFNSSIDTDGSTIEGGYRVFGYSTSKPYFNVYTPIENNQKTVLNVEGAVGEVYKNFVRTKKKIPYGTLYKTKQQIVDFLNGYGEYLNDQKFSFDMFSNELNEVANWQTSIKEFLYWTTQGWAPGSVIALSPGATGFNVETENSVVGQLRNILGNYTVLDAGGRKINNKDISTKRQGKAFSIETTGESGIYNIALTTVQKEHIILFDNKTAFNDIIFDLATGFRQKRLKLIGWKTANWNGDYYSPGFIFDEARVNLWSANTDYQIGANVEYNAKFYVAKRNHNSGSQFDNNQWTLKDEKPRPQLIPNFDYKISQFNDFYDLETNNFDESQQSLAQHLIGYQKRDYLENLLVNDVSQYKFYQGYIREKGTQNAIDKLLKAQFNQENADLSLFSDWMFRVGEFGDIDGHKNIQLKLDDSVYNQNPQSIEILDGITTEKSYLRSVSVNQEDMYETPLEYTASSTFEMYDLSKQGLSVDSVSKLKTAGYVREDDVDHTAFDIVDLKNLAVGEIQNKDRIWIANNESKDWDVLRISSTEIKVIALKTENENTQLRIVFNKPHGLAADDYFILKESQFVSIDGVYQVQSVVNSTVLTVEFDGTTFTGVAVLQDESTLSTYGNLYKMVSVRLASIDDVNTNVSYNQYRELDTVNNVDGDKVFVDDLNGKWKVFEKSYPYTRSLINAPDVADNQEFGHRIVARNDSRTIAVSSPTRGQGVVSFLTRTPNTTEYGITLQYTNTANNDTTSRYGDSMSISSDENFVIVGAPLNNSIGLDGSTRFNDSGLVDIFQWSTTQLKYNRLEQITSPVDAASQNFGWAHACAEPSANDKYLLVSAPGTENDRGKVYIYRWVAGADGSTLSTWSNTQTLESPIYPGRSNERFGHRMAINHNGDILAVSAKSPGTAGKVYIFTRSSDTTNDSTTDNFTLRQTLTGVSADGSSINLEFGEGLSMSKDGTTLVVTAPGYDNGTQDDAGVMYYYKWNDDGSTLTYTLKQTLVSPETNTNMKFGSSVAINQAGNRVVIGAEKFANTRDMKFDLGATTFDLQDTEIVDIHVGSGGAFTATMYDAKFVVDGKLISSKSSSDDDFGRGVTITDQMVLVGAPDDDINVKADGSTISSNDGSVTLFETNTTSTYSWKELRTQPDLVDERKIISSFLYDRSASSIISYLNYYDPMKGRILGLADREINYKTPFDPALYNYNTTGTVSDNPWAEEHVGEVWWDLSKVKYVWYEQGDQEFKLKNWGKLFPGSSVDVFEWVETTLLPTEYLDQSNTQQGQLAGVSGSPLDGDNTKFTIKQRYNSITNSFQNYYYYWVKDSVNLPDMARSVVNRKNTTSYVANLIQFPFSSGEKYFAVTGKNKFILFNTKENLFNDNIVVNIDYGVREEPQNTHSVWKIVSEGNKDSVIPTELESKWWDSLIGSDKDGRMVPDTNLPVNRRYGTLVRPRQSWYIDRYEALKELIQRANTEMKKHQLANSVSYVNLDSEESQPTSTSGEWDEKVNSYEDLTYVDTRDISGNAKFLVETDEANSNNFWAIYEWNGTEWNRIKVQTYKTKEYYSLVDWYKTSGEMSHDENTYIDKQVKFEYELDGLDLPIDSHVKVTSADTGGWKIYMKTKDGWENVATENGTIEFKASLYDYSIDDTGFAGDDTFDENFFDQRPSIETRKILQAIRDDIFINDLKLAYNELFFAGIHRVLSEQMYVDWAFKSSFISAKNSLRPLAQRKTYTTGTDGYIESYINEVKPFHTKLREYNLAYTSIDTQDGINTDFDLPPYYDDTSSSIKTLTNTNQPTTLMTEYPNRFWRDNHKKYVKSITVTSGGSGYVTAPTVTIVGGHTNSTGPFQIYGKSTTGLSGGSTGWFYPLFTSKVNAEINDRQAGGSGQTEVRNFERYPGVDFYIPVTGKNDAKRNNPNLYKEYDPGSVVEATATAIVQGGSVTKINVVTSGSGYTATPAVLLTGGGTGGSTPSTTAKAAIVLENDLVRDFDTTIKFDRVSKTGTVKDWATSTEFFYGDLLRYKNELYRVTNYHTSGSTFDSTSGNVQKLRGDESFLTAAERTLGFYAPENDMPGLELNQVMTGVDYGGVMVTGLLFNDDQGWDRSGWYNNPWDNYGSTNTKVLYGDGSTATYTFATALTKDQVYTVYFNGVRQTNDVFRGDGSTVTFTFTSAPGNGVKVELIPFDEDKVLTPTDDRTLDSLVSGGLFKSALGVAPSDTIIEGDAFITPETSFAPEENVPGSIFDTLDINVYTAPESGVPFVVNKQYQSDGTTRTYSIGQTPGTQASVVVSVEGATKKLGTDYTVDTAAGTITFTTAPVLHDKINVRSFAISGSNYLVFNKFVGDGSTTSFTTSSRESFQLDSSQSQLFVTLDGQPTTSFTSTSTGKLITITFSSAPTAGQSVQVAGFNQTPGTGRAYAEIRSEDVTYDGSTNRYTLTYPAGTIGPFAGLTFVELNGKILRGPDNTYYMGDGSTYSFSVDAGLSDGSTVDPAKTISSASDLEVYKNGIKQTLNTDYTVDLVNKNIEMVLAPFSSDVIAISTLVDTHYTISGNDIVLVTSKIASDGYSLSTNDTLRITTFNNALGMKQRREVLEGRVDGIFELRFAPLNSDFVFVYLNGDELVQGSDWNISGQTITVSGQTLTPSDRLDVLYFAVQSAESSTGFRIFKDMLNRSFYKRVSETHTTILKSQLNDSDDQIEVEDGSKIAPVDGSTRMPGVVFIDKERIEYFVKENNTLKQIRRGTLGTGIKVHVPGVKVVDASGNQTVPYADTVYTKTYTGDGSTTVFATQTAPSSASELDIFIGGQRLLLTSEDGSTVNYSVDGSTANVTLTSTPASGVQVKIIQKQGQTWYTAGTNTAADGKGLQASSTQQAKFIAGEPTNAPE